MPNNLSEISEHFPCQEEKQKNVPYSSLDITVKKIEKDAAKDAAWCMPQTCTEANNDGGVFPVDGNLAKKAPGPIF
ncbi:hypothetical protein O9929_02880 [Vibrio lentus]|nr:hypothetical protein [Vibrio lentus]